MTNRIIREKHPNQSVRQYHVNTKISDKFIERFTFPMDSYEQRNLSEVGTVGAGVVQEISSVPGVKEIFLEPYEIHVEIGRAFLWAEIDPKIIAILKKTFTDPAQIKISTTGDSRPWLDELRAQLRGDYADDEHPLRVQFQRGG